MAAIALGGFRPFRARSGKRGIRPEVEIPRLRSSSGWRGRTCASATFSDCLRPLPHLGASRSTLARLLRRRRDSRCEFSHNPSTRRAPDLELPPEAEVPRRSGSTSASARHVLAGPDACSDLDAAQEAGGRSEGLTFWFILNRFAGSYRRLICANRSKFTP